jgi:hypothetical protein
MSGHGIMRDKGLPESGEAREMRDGLGLFREIRGLGHIVHTGVLLATAGRI